MSEENDIRTKLGGEFDENGNRIETAITSKEKGALRFLEQLSGFAITDDDVANIIGVFVGLKKIAYIDNNSFALNPQLLNVISALGLITDSREDLYTKGRVNRVVAKNLEDVKNGLNLVQKQEEFLIQRNVFKKLTDFFRGDNRSSSPKLQELDRQLGKMLGYPETSAVAFFDNKKRHQMQGHPLEARYAHTKEHYQEEIEAYDLPLAQAVQELVPETFTNIYGKRLKFANSQKETEK